MAKLGSTTVTGNLSVSGTINGYKLAESARRGVDTAISSGSTSTNIPTTKAIVDYVNSAIKSWCDNHTATPTVSGRDVIIPPGYYPTQITKTVGDGAYSAAAGGSEARKANVKVSATATGFDFLAKSSPSPYYITVSGAQSSAGSVNATSTATVTTAGWLTTGNKSASKTIETGATVSTADNSDNGKYYIPTGTISAGTSAKSGWVTNTSAAAVVPANGYLYISAGYYPNTPISLSTLIPDDSNFPNAGNGRIVSGFEAYDTNGAKLVGTIARLDRKDDKADTAENLNRHYKYKYPDGTNKDYYTQDNNGLGNIGPGHLADTWYIKKGAFTYSSSTAANAAVVTVSTDGWFDKQTVCKIDSDGETLVINV